MQWVAQECENVAPRAGSRAHSTGGERIHGATDLAHPAPSPAALPRLLSPGEPAGALTGEAASALGLREGTLVAPGGGDNMMSAIGSGATRPGVCVLSLGTSGTVFAYRGEPTIDPAGLIAPFCDSTGGWQREGAPWISTTWTHPAQ